MIRVRRTNEDDRQWIVDLLTREWGERRIVTRGVVHFADELPGYIAEIGGEAQGLLTFSITERECELVSLNSLRENVGIGTALLDAAMNEARERKLNRVWLITTNDNLHAIRFYQKYGFMLSALYPNAISLSRRLKPSIPELGIGGIPIRDELELEIRLG